MLPKISVIVPVYNVEPYLTECLEHVIHQTYQNLEIILVDDGSTDNSGHICDEYARCDSHVIVIHQKNGGLSAARNTGLRTALAEEQGYIGFIDSDDYPELDMYEKMMRLAMQYQADMVVVSVFREPGRRNQEANVKRMSKTEFLQDMANNGAYSASAYNKLYKAELWNGIEYPIGKISEDVFTTYKLVDKSECVVVTTEELYFYRSRQNSITNQPFRTRDLDLVTGSLEFEDYLKHACPKAVKPQRHDVTRNAAAILRKYLNAKGDSRDTEQFLLSVIRRDIPSYLFSRYKLSSKLFACACAVNFGMVKKLWPLLKKLQDG